ncbi:MAG: PKD domain-containing protein [Bacteroidota bacterium]
MLKRAFYILFTLVSTVLCGQEICNNGIDDDGNGLVDCYDPQCSNNAACSNFFYGKPVISCTTNPTNPAFTLNTVWQSSMNVSTRSTMMVGDMDGDGTPDVVCHNNGANELYILDGQTGSIEVTINCPAIADHVDAIAIGDTDDDGLGEIYVVTGDNVLRCFENDGTPKVGFVPPATDFTNESIPGIADFDQDGVPEIYKDNKIYHSLTGALIASGTGSTGNNPGSNGAPASMPVAADVLPDGYCADCSGLELVSGNVVYAVNIAGGTLTAVPNSLPGILLDGFTSIGDMDMDGQLDVVVVSSGTIYVWDPRTGLQMGNTISIPNTTAGGRANIADYDNDGLPEIGAGGLNRYIVVDVDTATNLLSEKWVKTIVDGSQHTTGSVFDFDCDGRAQVVYRDENNLYVWDGETGTVSASIPCGSATRSEFPTIVDVDGDGQVNIVCACASVNQGATGVVKVFNSSTNQWVGSRKVMNQHSYSVVNINDDLSVPAQQQNYALLPKLNGFLAQAPIFDVNWNTSCIPLANVNLTIDSVIYCQKPDSVVILLSICNIGSKVAASPIKTSVYNGNPLSGGTLVSTFSLSSSILPDSCSKDTIAVPFSGTAATFYVYVNDNGSSPSAAPETVFSECDSSNNSDFVLINSPALPVSISGDTSICINDSTTLTATGATMFTWTPSTGLNTASGHVVVAKPLLTTTYTLTGTDVNSGCDSTITITVHVNPKPAANFGNTSVCNGIATQFNDSSTTSLGTINSWSWNFGDGSLLNTNQDPFYLYANSNIYSTILIVGNNFGCADTVTKSVQVYHKPVAAFTHAAVCFGDSVVFSNSSTINSPASITSYVWEFGDGSSTSNFLSPTHLYATSGVSNVTLITSSNNGCKDTVTNAVNTYDFPVSLFSFSNTCLSDSANFINTSTAPTIGSIASWSWDFGDGSAINTGWSPTHLYASAGDYQVILITLSSNLGCADTLKDSITVYSLPVANFGFADVCLNQAMNFYDSSYVTNGSISSWSWNFGDGSVSVTTQNAVYMYMNAGAYTVSLIVASANGCKDTVVKNVVVHPLPVAHFTTDNACDGSSVAFNDASSIPVNPGNDALQSWSWDFGDNTAPATGQTPSHLYGGIGSYAVQLTVVSDFGCIDLDNSTVVVNPNPVVNFISSDTIGCEELCVTFQNNSSISTGTMAAALLNYGDGNTSVGSQDLLNCYKNDSVYASVSYTLTLTVTSDSGCVSSLTKNNYITVYPLPEAGFNVQPSTVMITDPVISVTDISTGAELWNWNFDDLQTSNIYNPAPHTYSDTGTYVIRLITSNQYSCADTAYQTITVEPKFLFYIPSAFSPNEDGLNDSFIPKGSFINEFEMKIFDRWGNLIYSSESIDKPWDGKANRGSEVAQQDVYVYSIKVTDFKNLKHIFRGIVTLVK